MPDHTQTQDCNQFFQQVAKDRTSSADYQGHLNGCEKKWLYAAWLYLEAGSLATAVGASSGSIYAITNLK
jgi:hypothetical protein